MGESKTNKEAFMDFLKPHIDAYLAVIKNFSVFDGRAGRNEFWMFCLYNLIIGAALGIVSSILSGIPFIGRLFGMLFSIVSGLYGLAIFVVSLAVGVRRLHDTDRSGLTWLLALIPLVGIIIVIVFWVQEGTVGDNKYGSEPKVGGMRKSQKTKSSTPRSSSKKPSKRGKST